MQYHPTWSIQEKQQFKVRRFVPVGCKLSRFKKTYCSSILLFLCSLNQFFLSTSLFLCIQFTLFSPSKQLSWSLRRHSLGSAFQKPVLSSLYQSFAAQNIWNLKGKAKILTKERAMGALILQIQGSRLVFHSELYMQLLSSLRTVTKAERVCNCKLMHSWKEGWMGHLNCYNSIICIYQNPACNFDTH